MASTLKKTEMAMQLADKGDLQLAQNLLMETISLIESRHDFSIFIEAYLYCSEEYLQLGRFSIVEFLDRMHAYLYSEECSEAINDKENFWANAMKLLIFSLDAD
jgi:hypothetical protein